MPTPRLDSPTPMSTDLTAVEGGARQFFRRTSLGGIVGVPVTIVLLLALGTLASPEFLTVRNLVNVLTSASLLGIVAIGMSFVTISGGWADLSVPAVIATGAIIQLGSQPVLGTMGAMVLALAACAAAGAVNGVVIGYIKANPIVVTLGTNIIILGIAQALVGGQIVYNTDDVANAIVGGQFFGVPFIVIVFLFVALIAHLMLARTVWGRWTLATGGNYAAASASGVPVKRVRAFAFVISSLLAGVTGCLLALSLQSVRPVLGAGYEFSALTALAVGGISLLGGAGSIARVLGGLLIIQILSNIMVLLGFPTTAHGVAEGVVIIFAVAIDIRLRRKTGGL